MASSSVTEGRGKRASAIAARDFIQRAVGIIREEEIPIPPPIANKRGKTLKNTVSETTLAETVQPVEPADLYSESDSEEADGAVTDMTEGHMTMTMANPFKNDVGKMAEGLNVINGPMFRREMALDNNLRYL